MKLPQTLSFFMFCIISGWRPAAQTSTTDRHGLILQPPQTLSFYYVFVIASSVAGGQPPKHQPQTDMASFSSPLKP